MDGKWTPKMVAVRMEEAANVLKRLPKNNTRLGYYSFWPDIIPGINEGQQGSETLVRLGPPSPEAITRMDKCFEWLRWLEPDLSKLVWLRAEKTPWKVITRQLGIARSTASSKRDTAILQIVAILNLPTNKNVQTSLFRTSRKETATILTKLKRDA